MPNNIIMADAKGADVLYGSVTVGSDKTVVIPVPIGYSFVCWIDSATPTRDNNYLAEFGEFKNLTSGGTRKWNIKGITDAGNGWKITRTATNVSYQANNGNTVGLAPEGSAFKYFAWR